MVYISLVDTSEKSEPTQDRSFLANILQNGTCFRSHIPKILTIVPAFYKKKTKNNETLMIFSLQGQNCRHCLLKKLKYRSVYS